MSPVETPGRLPLWRAALVIARRDFVAVLMSRTFLFFLLGPFFPVLIAVLAGGIGSQMQSEVAVEQVGVAMDTPAQTRALMTARNRLANELGGGVPALTVLDVPPDGLDARAALSGEENLAAVVTGTLAAPQLTATQGRIDRWNGVIGRIAADALSGEVSAPPPVDTDVVATSTATETRGRLGTAQGGQLLLFLLTMLLAGMVLSNLVEEKGNKIIEILAAAIPMDAVFLGKLFAMLGVSLVGIAVWGGVGGAILIAGGRSLSDFANPGVGWPAFLLLFALYFAMAYLLLGSIFLAIGSLATTVREVQTLSMPVTMAQVMVFFLASLAVLNQGKLLEWIAIGFPLSSPFAMLARAATREELWPHLLALAYQAAWVALFIKLGAALFRKKVMKSGPQKVKTPLWKRVFRNGSA